MNEYLDKSNGLAEGTPDLTCYDTCKFLNLKFLQNCYELNLILIKEKQIFQIIYML